MLLPQMTESELRELILAAQQELAQRYSALEDRLAEVRCTA